MSVIDLGELVVDSDAHAAPTARSRSAAGLGRWKILVIAACAVASGSANPVGPRLATVARIPIATSAQMLVDGGYAVVVDVRNGQSEISAYALPGGHPAWTRMVADSASMAAVVATATAVITTATTKAGSDSTAFDLVSGAQLWKRPANGAVSTTAGILLVGTGAAGTGPENASVIDDGDRVALVDPRTGIERWTGTIPAGCIATLADNPADIVLRGMVELCADTGQLSVRSIATGAVVARRHLDLYPRPGKGHGPPASTMGRPSVVAVGNLTLVTVDSYPVPTIDAFHTADLATAQLGVSIGNSNAIVGCGPRTCMSSDASLSELRDVSGDSGPAVSYVGGDPTTLVVVPAGLAPVALGAGEAVEFEMAVPAGQVVRVPPGASGAVWIATESRSAGVELLQRLRGVRAQSCVPVSSYLACSTGAHELTFWALP